MKRSGDKVLSKRRVLGSLKMCSTIDRSNDISRRGTGPWPSHNLKRWREIVMWPSPTKFLLPSQSRRQAPLAGPRSRRSQYSVVSSPHDKVNDKIAISIKRFSKLVLTRTESRDTYLNMYRVDIPSNVISDPVPSHCKRAYKLISLESLADKRDRASEDIEPVKLIRNVQVHFMAAQSSRSLSACLQWLILWSSSRIPHPGKVSSRVLTETSRNFTELLSLTTRGSSLPGTCKAGRTELFRPSQGSVEILGVTCSIR